MGNDMRYARSEMMRETERQKREKRRGRAAKTTGAHTTDPIRDVQTVKKWLKIAMDHDRNRKRGGVSWYLLLLLGFNTSLRIGDLCALKVKDVANRERVRIIAEKTGKMSDIKLRSDVQERLSDMLRGRDGEEYALMSRQKSGKTGKPKGVSRQRAFAIVKEIARRAEFDGHAGCHTMRKTFAYDLYQTTGDLSLVQKALNHSSQMETLRYIGLDQAAMDRAIEGMHQMI